LCKEDNRAAFRFDLGGKVKTLWDLKIRHYRKLKDFVMVRYLKKCRAWYLSEVGR